MRRWLSITKTHLVHNYKLTILSEGLHPFFSQKHMANKFSTDYFIDPTAPVSSAVHTLHIWAPKNQTYNYQISQGISFKLKFSHPICAMCTDNKPVVSGLGSHGRTQGLSWVRANRAVTKWWLRSQRSYWSLWRRRDVSRSICKFSSSSLSASSSTSSSTTSSLFSNTPSHVTNDKVSGEMLGCWSGVKCMGCQPGVNCWGCWPTDSVRVVCWLGWGVLGVYPGWSVGLLTLDVHLEHWHGGRCWGILSHHIVTPPADLTAHMTTVSSLSGRTLHDFYWATLHIDICLCEI